MLAPLMPSRKLEKLLCAMPSTAASWYCLGNSRHELGLDDPAQVRVLFWGEVASKDRHCGKDRLALRLSLYILESSRVGFVMAQHFVQFAAKEFEVRIGRGPSGVGTVSAVPR